MTLKLLTRAMFVFSAGLSLNFTAQAADPKPGNCAVLAEMSAKTVKKDKRFKGEDSIVPALMKFADAQTVKMEAGMDETYELSKAFGWDKKKVDSMMKDSLEGARAGFFSSTMEKNKLYMEHVKAVYHCGQGQSNPADLGQSPEEFEAVMQKMAEIVRS